MEMFTFLFFCALGAWYEWKRGNLKRANSPLYIEFEPCVDNLDRNIPRYNEEVIKKKLVEMGFSANEAKRYIASARSYSPSTDDAMIMWAYYLYAKDLGIDADPPNETDGGYWPEEGEGMPGDPYHFC